MPLPQGAYRPGDAHLRSPAELAQKLVRFFIAGKRDEVSTRAVTTAPRDVRLDFFRGVALFLIFVDHIPGNVLSHFTVQSLGFSDAAEIFIFVSGYTAALVYGRAMLKQGVVIASAKVFHRVWQLYVAHIFIFLIFAALVSYNTLAFQNPASGKELHVAKFFAEPHIAVIRALELRFQPTFLDILPLYIVLLAGFPLVLLLLRQHVLTAVVVSFAVYFSGTNLWHFAAWLSRQSGVVLQSAWLAAPLRHRSRVRLPAVYRAPDCAAGRMADLIGPVAMIAAASAVIKLSWTVHDAWGPVPAILMEQLWPIDKSNLAPIRLAHFLALAVVVVRFVPAGSRFLFWRITQPINCCGQHSLQIFCLGIVLSVLGHFILTEWNDRLPAQLAVNAAGFALMIGAATLIGWYRAIDRATAPV